MPIPRSAIGLVTTDVEIRVDRYQLELFAQATGNMAGPYTDVGGPPPAPPPRRAGAAPRHARGG